jgi:effector-binding domain-containing protein
MMFAGIRSPIKNRNELLSRIAQLKIACEGVIIGPLTQIFRFDIQVDGFDSEIGFPVKSDINTEVITTHTLRELHTFSLIHRGPVDTIRDTTRKILKHMNKVGLSPELELIEIYHHFDPENQAENVIEIQASFLAWPEVYRAQLLRVLSPELSNIIWAGGEEITHSILKGDKFCAWDYVLEKGSDQ